MIGQFHCTKTKFKSLFELKSSPPLFGPRDIMNILLTWLFQLILWVLEPHFMAEMFCTWALNPNWEMSIICYMLIISLTYLQEIVLMSLSDHWTGEQVMKTDSRTLSTWTKVSLVMLFFSHKNIFHEGTNCLL